DSNPVSPDYESGAYTRLKLTALCSTVQVAVLDQRKDALLLHSVSRLVLFTAHSTALHHTVTYCLFSRVVNTLLLSVLSILILMRTSALFNHFTLLKVTYLLLKLHHLSQHPQA